MFGCRIGPDLELRLLENRHAEGLFAVTQRNREHLRKWLPWVDGTTSPQDTRAFIATALQRFAAQEGFAAGLWYRGELAGSIDLQKIDWFDRSSSIGYWLGADHQGKGLMTEACRAVVRYAFKELQLHRLEIRCAPGNARSCAIPERLGFKREGLLRQAQWVSGRWLDLVVYGLLANEWKG
jgi:ribosomal-protein-serine acetyltransferase